MSQVNQSYGISLVWDNATLLILSCILNFTVALVGFAQAQFMAFEDSGSVSVCLELCEGTTNRPIDVLLSTSDNTAVGKDVVLDPHVAILLL